MLDSSTVPTQWQPFVQLLTLPVYWIPGLQKFLINLAWSSDIWYMALAKRVFLLLPIVLVIVGLWCSMLSVYTLLFRPNRHEFLRSLLITWWDALRTIWFFWAGFFRLAFLSYGWAWGLVRLTMGGLFEIVRQIFVYPFLLMEQGAKKYFRPGVPWIALIMTIGWSALEATIFTYTLLPTITEVLSDLVGVETHTYAMPLLYMMLFTLISGSFACLYVLMDAVKTRNIKDMIQMAVVEFFVMFVEVIFLYRELVDAVSPWIAQQTGEKVQLGLVSTLAISSFAWMGIRGMTWFLFGRYGTATMLAIIGRQPIEGSVAVERKPDVSLVILKDMIDTLKRDTAWLHDKGEEMLDALTLPVLQLVACAINFAMVFSSSKPIFILPFKHLSEVMDTKELHKLANGGGRGSKGGD